MRIVIDGAAGSGKTTFLSCNFLSELRKKCSKDTMNISSLGYLVFPEMMQDAVNDAKKLNLIPPTKESEWKQLLNIIYKKAVAQFKAAEEEKICWYDRGLHFVKAFSDINNIELPQEIGFQLNKYKYDNVFVFEPIKDFDLSMPNNGKFGPMSLEDRYNEFKAIISAYEEFGHSVCVVPVFSSNLEVNFQKRFSYIKKRVSFL